MFFSWTGLTLASMKLARLSLVAASLLLCSNRPPPAHVPDKNILVQPGQPTVPVLPAAENQIEETVSAQTNAPEAEAGTPAATTDPELEKKMREAEAAEAARQKAAEEQQAAARAENCQRARNAVAMLESGQRMARMNEKGEREILNDEQRAAELQRARDIMNSSCD